MSETKAKEAKREREEREAKQRNRDRKERAAYIAMLAAILMSSNDYYADEAAAVDAARRLVARAEYVEGVIDEEVMADVR